MNKQVRKMKKKLLKMLDKQLTIGYVNNFLRNKSIATNKHDENAISFKLYNLNWDLFFDGGKLSIRSSFTLGDDIKIECMVKAINALNNERYIVKSYLNYVFPQDEQGNPIKDASGRTDLVFSFENFCFTESAFCEIYEFAVYAMADAIDYHRKLYNNYLMEDANQSQMPKIGFHSMVDQQSTATSTMNKQERRRIGFV